MPSPFGPLTLEELIVKLEATYNNTLPHHLSFDAHGIRPVYYDWCNVVPGNLMSYRGYSSHLSLGIELEKEVTVEALILKCKHAIDREFTGWNGLQNWIDKNAPVWVANYGDATGWGIIDVQDCGGHIELVTQSFE